MRASGYLPDEVEKDMDEVPPDLIFSTAAPPVLTLQAEPPVPEPAR